MSGANRLVRLLSVGGFGLEMTGVKVGFAEGGFDIVSDGGESLFGEIE